MQGRETFLLVSKCDLHGVGGIGLWLSLLKVCDGL